VGKGNKKMKQGWIEKENKEILEGEWSLKS